MVGFTAQLDDILRAAEDAGFTSDVLVPGQTGEASLEATVDATGETFSAEPPPAAKVIELVPDGKQFTATLQECIAR